MASSQLFLCFSLIFLSVYGADGFMECAVNQCLFNSAELRDMEYIFSMYFNKVEFVRFNSTVGKFVGYNEHGMKNAEIWNNDPAQLATRRGQLERVCLPNVQLWYRNILGKTAKPYVRISSVTPSAGGHTAMLVCSIYDFYPKNIRVTWLRNGLPVTSDVTSTDELVDGDWYYQIHSHLEYTPKSGEKISCMVEHASLDKPLVENWDPSLPESEKSKIAIGASGLLLGLVLSLAGFIYYRRKVRGRILVPSN
ncbi:H-2 class II histocompatibility antigen, E-S beta chain-like [Polymixia lowei]